MARRPYISGEVDDDEMAPFGNFDPNDLKATMVSLEDDTIEDEDALLDDEDDTPKAKKPSKKPDDDDDQGDEFDYLDDDDDTYEEERGAREYFDEEEYVDGDEEDEEDDPTASKDEDDGGLNDEFFRQQRIREGQLRQRLEHTTNAIAREMHQEVQEAQNDLARAAQIEQNLQAQYQELAMQAQLAEDEENTAALIRLNNAMQGIRGDLGRVSEVRAQIASEQEIKARYQQRAAEAQGQIVQEFGPMLPQPKSDTAKQWMKRNGWIANPKNAAATQEILRINDQLVADGWTEEDNSFYAEMAKRLKAKFPDLPIKDQNGRPFGAKRLRRGRPVAKNPPKRPPAGGARRMSPEASRSEVRRGKNGKRVVRLSPSDHLLMHGMGKGGNREFMEAFAREKAQRITEEKRAARMKRSRS